MAKTILFGAFGRHNFGDMLFAWVVQAALRQAGYQESIEFCDLLARDMRPFGGHDVKSIASFFEDEDLVNLVCVGGEVGSCHLNTALSHLSPERHHVSQIKKYRSFGLQSAYVLDKKSFKKPGVFVANSIGGFSGLCADKLRAYDFVGFRDKKSYFSALESGISLAKFLPDCAILTRGFFADRIQDSCDSDAMREFREATQARPYIAFQLKANMINSDTIPCLRREIASLARETGLPVVFFRAGAAPSHDSLEKYILWLADNLEDTQFYLFESLNIWDICHLIAHADVVVSSSLHVRIIAMQFGVPRLIFASEQKHLAFLRHWDSPAASNSSTQFQTMSRDAVHELKHHDVKQDLDQLSSLSQLFFESSSWLSLLGN